MKYCGIQRPMRRASGDVVAANPMHSSEPYKSLGDQILTALKYGSDLGSPVPVDYDQDDDDSVDLLCSPNHDHFDIAEMADVAPEQATRVGSSKTEEKTE